MKQYVFIISVHGFEAPYIVDAKTDDEAYQKMHAFLKGENPDMWCDDWRDFKEGLVERGEQTCYGPWDKIPHLN